MPYVPAFGAIAALPYAHDGYAICISGGGFGVQSRRNAAEVSMGRPALGSKRDDGPISLVCPQLDPRASCK